MSTHVHYLLERALERSGISKQVLAARIVEEARRITREVLGPENSKYIDPASYTRGELCVHVRAPVAGVELRQHEERLLAELRKKFPRTRIDRLTILPSGRGSRGP